MSPRCQYAEAWVHDPVRPCRQEPVLWTVNHDRGAFAWRACADHAREAQRWGSEIDGPELPAEDEVSA